MIHLKPIGKVSSTRTVIKDDYWDEEDVFIELDLEMFDNQALKGLEEFSHVEVIFYMDLIDKNLIEVSSRHPRNNVDWPKVGIFSQRGKNRPNQLGLTICLIKKIEGLKLYVEGLDAVNGTPVLDIKPWVKEFGPRGSVFQPNWISELMKNYWN